MKKTFVVALTAVLAAFVLVGCGEKKPASSTPSSTPSSSAASSTDAQSAAVESSSYNLEDIVTAVEQANPVANARAVDENYITLDMLLTKENIAAFSGKVSNDQGNSALIVAIQAVEGKAADVKAELTAYKSSISTGGMYAEFADMETMAKDARIVEKGDYLVMVVANTQGADYAEIDKALDEALK